MSGSPLPLGQADIGEPARKQPRTAMKANDHPGPGGGTQVNRVRSSVHPLRPVPMGTTAGAAAPILPPQLHRG